MVYNLPGPALKLGEGFEFKTNCSHLEPVDMCALDFQDTCYQCVCFSSFRYNQVFVVCPLVRFLVNLDPSSDKIKREEEEEKAFSSVLIERQSTIILSTPFQSDRNKLNFSLQNYLCLSCVSR